MLVTEEHREAVKQEFAAEKERNKMSAAAAAKLRQINEHTRLNKEANVALVKWFNEQPKTVEFLMDVMYLIRRNDVLNIRKRAVKCFAMLARGFKVNEIHDVLFFGELLPEEESMSLAQILSRYPVSDEPLITPIVLAEAKVRTCALGSKCLRAYRRKPAEGTGTGKYCSDHCRGAAKMTKKREKVMWLCPDCEAGGGHEKQSTPTLGKLYRKVALIWIVQRLHTSRVLSLQEKTTQAHGRRSNA
jgi:hypothetical protein